MRLINARSLRLEEHLEGTHLKYAILSHRWGDGEVSFQDMRTPEVRLMKGFSKIRLSCAQALNDGLKFVWVDTCCIDKTSSAELSEAINSMYRWYQNSTVCYAYLSDVKKDKDIHDVPTSFVTSAWFTRGWTLQELIAPRKVVFYDDDWQFLGTKGLLGPRLADITGIDEAVLEGESIKNRSVAQRMSWASGRTTTRLEDMAYSLMGIFDVNMPMLYGEGAKAFYRLQEEIIRQSDDQSIFAWSIRRDDKSSDVNSEPVSFETGLLASSPAAFAGCQHVRVVGSRQGRAAYTITNRGLSMKLDCIPWAADTYLAALYCVNELLHKSDEPLEDFRMGMFLRRLPEDDQYIRVTYDNETFIQGRSVVWTRNTETHPVRQISFSVRQRLLPGSEAALLPSIYGFRFVGTSYFDVNRKGEPRYKISAGSSSSKVLWNATDQILRLPPGGCGTVGSVDLSFQSREIKVIKLGFDFDFNPVINIAYSSGIERKTKLLDRNGAIAWNDGVINSQYSDEERAQWAGVYDRHPDDKLGWNAVGPKNIVKPLEQHSGLFNVKGDRVHGLSVLLGYAGGESVKITRGEFEGALVWNVRIEDERDRNRIVRLAQEVEREKEKANANASTEADAKEKAEETSKKKKSTFGLFKK